ncbi:MAG TPA: hypothetical protein VK778_11375 [Solirubrobacteraceae bacterium]|jgi:hypothetical protein|nr:hypothetical protein [Solirubrobacteraceae bacterium]
MRRTRKAGFTFVGIIAVGVVMVASASAAVPEFEQTATFTSVGTEAVLLEGKGGGTITCQESEGEKGLFMAGTKEATKIILRLKGCATGAEECQNAGAGSKEIKTEPLKGTVGYLETESVAGAPNVAFALVTELNNRIALFKCGAKNLEINGCVAGTLAEANKPPANKFTLRFKQAGGMQEIVSYEPEKGKPEACKGVTVDDEGEVERAGLKTAAKIITCPNMKIKD